MLIPRCFKKSKWVFWMFWEHGNVKRCDEWLKGPGEEGKQHRGARHPLHVVPLQVGAGRASSCCSRRRTAFYCRWMSPRRGRGEREGMGLNWSDNNACVGGSEEQCSAWHKVPYKGCCSSVTIRAYENYIPGGFSPFTAIYCWGKPWKIRLISPTLSWAL